MAKREQIRQAVEQLGYVVGAMVHLLSLITTHHAAFHAPQVPVRNNRQRS